MSIEHPQEVLHRLSTDLSVALVPGSPLRLQLTDGVHALVQPMDDGALLIHARWPSELQRSADPEEFLADLLSRNAPTPESPAGAVFGLDESDIVAFSRIERPAAMLPQRVLHWALAFIRAVAGDDAASRYGAALQNGSSDPLSANSDEFDALMRELRNVFNLPARAPKDAGDDEGEDDEDEDDEWMLVPDDGLPVSLHYCQGSGEIGKSIDKTLDAGQPDWSALLARSAEIRRRTANGEAPGAASKAHQLLQKMLSDGNRL